MAVDLSPFLDSSLVGEQQRAATVLHARAELNANGFLLLTAGAAGPAADAASASEQQPRSLLSDAGTETMFDAARRFFVAAECDPAVAKAATSVQAAATRGYAPVLTENFGSLIGTVGASNDFVAKFRVGPRAERDDAPPWLTTPWPPEECAPGFRQTATACFDEFESVAAAAARLLSMVVGNPAIAAAIPEGDSSSILSLNRYAISARQLAELRAQGQRPLLKTTEYKLSCS